MNYWEVIAAVLTALLGSGLIQFFINRNDGKKKQLDQIEKKLDDHIAKDEEDTIVNIRVRILRQAEDLRRNNGKSTKGMMDQALDDITKYEHYCDAHPMFKNHITVAAEQYIESCYKEMMINNTFLM